MKILHTSDWHLGAVDGNHSLLEDQKFFIDEICEIVRTNKVDAVIIAGDVYDRAVSSDQAIRLYDQAMTRLCRDLKVKVIIIAGNHDSAQRLSSCRELLSSAGLYLSGSLERELKKVSFDDTDIYLLPWISEEKVKSIFPEKKEEISSLEDAYRVVTANICMDKNKRNIIVSHAFITNAQTCVSDRAAEIGRAARISGSVFDGFDYVALGHIHKPQNVSDTIRYSGTPMPYSFGKEEKQEKSVTIIDTKDMSQSIIPLKLLHSRNTICAGLDEILKADYPEEVRKGYVRIQVTDHYVGLEILSELKKIFPGLLELAGKTFEEEGSSVTLTMEELERLQENPMDVFRYFCNEEMGMEADEHLTELFEAAVKHTLEEDI